MKAGETTEELRKDPVMPSIVTRDSGEPPILFADSPTGQDALGHSSDIDLLAELVGHARAGTPFTLGLLGGAGSGKSFFLDKLLRQIDRLAAAAAKLGPASPFLARIVTARVEATEATRDPVAAIAASVHDALLRAAPDGTSYASLAEEAAHATGDPQAAAHEASDRLDAARRRLDAERQALGELDGRRARLTETVLYEAAGSRVDAFARSNRARIEQRLKLFGFASGDPVANYKDLVRDVVESGGSLPQVPAFLRAVWGFRGQFRLIVAAIALALLGWSAELAVTYRSEWIPRLWAISDQLAPTGVWIQSHIDYFIYLRNALYGLAVVCLLLNLWRAFRFTRPVLKGVSLLQADVEQRRADLEGQHQHQSRRVEALADEADRTAQRAEEAERRARSGATPAMASIPTFAARDDPAEAARTFLVALARLLQVGSSADAASMRRPQRIVVALDKLDDLPATDAAAVVTAAHDCLAHAGFLIIAAVDRSHLVSGFSGSGSSAGQRRLEKLVQIPFDLSALRDASDIRADLVARLVSQRPAIADQRTDVDARTSRLNPPWSDADSALLRALGPMASETPRGAKRFVNLARLARAQSVGAPDGPAHFASLAVALALDVGGTPDEIAAFDRSLDMADIAFELSPPAGFPRLSAALDAARTHTGVPLSAGDLKRGRNFARRYSLRPQPLPIVSGNEASVAQRSRSLDRPGADAEDR